MQWRAPPSPSGLGGVETGPTRFLAITADGKGLCTLLVDDQAAALVAGAIGWKVWLASAVEEATLEVVEDEVWQVGGRRKSAASESSSLWTHWVGPGGDFFPIAGRFLAGKFLFSQANF